MSNALDNVIAIWSDLENSYATRGQGMSKSEYLKKITLYDSATKTHKLNVLLTRINGILQSGDVPTTSIGVVTTIVEMLKDLSTYLDTNEIPKKIPNLNAFIISNITAKEPEFTIEDLHKLSIASRKEPTVVSYEDMFRHHQSFKETIVCNNTEQLTYSHFIGEEVSGDIVAMYPNEVVNYYVDRQKSRKAKDKEILSCIHIYVTYLNPKKVLAIVDKSLLEINGDEVTLLGHTFKYKTALNGTKKILFFSSRGAEICSVL